LWSIGHPWRASRHCDLQLFPWPHSMIFLFLLFHPLLSFATFSSAYLFFYIPEDSNLMLFSLLLLLLCVMCVQSNYIFFFLEANRKSDNGEVRFEIEINHLEVFDFNFLIHTHRTTNARYITCANLRAMSNNPTINKTYACAQQVHAHRINEHNDSNRTAVPVPNTFKTR
jgi:hypothetical protein